MQNCYTGGGNMNQSWPQNAPTGWQNGPNYVGCNSPTPPMLYQNQNVPQGCTDQERYNGRLNRTYEGAISECSGGSSPPMNVSPVVCPPPPAPARPCTVAQAEPVFASTPNNSGRGLFCTSDVVSPMFNPRPNPPCPEDMMKFIPYCANQSGHTPPIEDLGPFSQRVGEFTEARVCEFKAAIKKEIGATAAKILKDAIKNGLPQEKIQKIAQDILTPLIREQLQNLVARKIQNVLSPRVTEGLRKLNCDSDFVCRRACCCGRDPCEEAQQDIQRALQNQNCPPQQNQNCPPQQIQNYQQQIPNCPPQQIQNYQQQIPNCPPLQFQGWGQGSQPWC